MNEYLFISDIHGRDPSLEKQVCQIAKENPPKIVFFLGDIVGTNSLDKLHKLFYNGVYNAAKKLLNEKPNTSDNELLMVPIDNNRTIENGLDDLWIYLYGNVCVKADKAKYIRELEKYYHYGHFASNLPQPIHLSLEEDLKENAKIWINIMTNFTNVGSMVVVIEGNWDARNPLDFLANKNQCIPLPIKDRSFYFKDLLKSLNNKVLYFDEVGTIETKKEIFVLWPFDIAAADITTQVPEFDENQKTKKIILVSHGQIDWFSIKGNTPMTDEGQKIQNNMGTTFHDLRASTAVHGHLHDDIGTDGYFFNEKFIHYLPKGTCRFIDF
jgi:Icc-related predicted phosphoesterase